MKIEEVRQLAKQDENGGQWWLAFRDYDRREFREAWSRIGDEVPGRKEPPVQPQSQQPAASQEVRKPREDRNGVKGPGSGGKCAVVWEHLDIHPAATAKEMREVAASVGWNLNNTSIEYYQWRSSTASGDRPTRQELIALS